MSPDTAPPPAQCGACKGTFPSTQLRWIPVPVFGMMLVCASASACRQRAQLSGIWGRVPAAAVML